MKILNKHSLIVFTLLISFTGNSQKTDYYVYNTVIEVVGQELQENEFSGETFTIGIDKLNLNNS